MKSRQLRKIKKMSVFHEGPAVYVNKHGQQTLHDDCIALTSGKGNAAPRAIKGASSALFPLAAIVGVIVAPLWGFKLLIDDARRLINRLTGTGKAQGSTTPVEQASMQKTLENAAQRLSEPIAVPLVLRQHDLATAQRLDDALRAALDGERQAGRQLVLVKRIEVKRGNHQK